MKKEIWYFIISIVAVIIIVKACEQEPKIITKTEIQVIEIKDTIKKVIIEEVPKIVYIEKIKTLPGKDSIVYVTEPGGDNNTIIANEYNTTLKADSAQANLKIVTTGELLDIKGTITYPEKTITNDIITIKPKSGLFLYGEGSVLPIFRRAEIGLDYQIRNTVIIGSSIDYNNVTKDVGANIKLGIRIF